MKTIRLHGTSLTVSQLCMGTANFGTTLSPQQAHAHLDRFWELGGNLIDTAHVYNDWVKGERSRSEKIIGQWLRTHRREDVVLCTKGGHPDLTAAGVSRVTPEQITIDLTESLQYLQTDYIDLYMLHRDNPAIPANEIMDCLDSFVQQGRVRYLACSNWTAERTAEANRYAKENGRAPFVVNELLWSMAKPNRSALPADYVVMDEKMMQLGVESGLSFLCFSALARGYLTRRYAEAPISDELHRTYDNAENETLLEKLKLLPDARCVTHASLQYFAHQPVTAVPVVAFSSMEQLCECAGAFADDAY